LEAVESGSLPNILFALLSESSYTSAHYSQAFIRAVGRRDYTAAEFLLIWGADLNAVDEHAGSALHVAVLARDIKGVMFLLRKGANHKVLDGAGKIPEDYLNADGEESESYVKMGAFFSTFFFEKKLHLNMFLVTVLRLAKLREQTSPGVFLCKNFDEMLDEIKMTEM
jgi:ankyrin repeat protein